MLLLLVSLLPWYANFVLVSVRKCVFIRTMCDLAASCASQNRRFVDEMTLITSGVCDGLQVVNKPV